MISQEEVLLKAMRQLALGEVGNGQWVSYGTGNDGFRLGYLAEQVVKLIESRNALQAQVAALEVEWGVLYEVSSSEEVIVACESEEEAREHVSISPTDTGLQQRLVTSWKAVD